MTTREGQTQLSDRGSMLDLARTISDTELLGWYDAQRAGLEHAQNVSGRLEQEMLQRMEARGATAIPSDEYVCELVVRNTYDQARFRPFLEILSERELQGVFTPAHEETVEVVDKWNTQKLVALAKRYGAEALRIIEQAKLPGARTLKFTKREVKT